MRSVFFSLGVTPALMGLAVSGALFFGSLGSPKVASASTCGDLLYGIFYNVGQGNIDYARFLAALYAENEC
jgi:hypothetical protein